METPAHLRMDMWTSTLIAELCASGKAGDDPNKQRAGRERRVHFGYFCIVGAFSLQCFFFFFMNAQKGGNATDLMSANY